MLRIETARPDDFSAVCRFYDVVCAAQATEPCGPDWHYGVYPSEADLAEHIGAGELVLGRCGDEIAAAMVVVPHEDPEYIDVSWAMRQEPIHVLHLLAVHPAFRGQGHAKAMLRYLLDSGREHGAKAVHLDVVKGNFSAEELYRSLGFGFVEERGVWYEDTGDLTVRLYEYLIVPSGD